MLKRTLLHEFFGFSRQFLPGRLYKFRDRIFTFFGIRVKDLVIPINGVYFHIDSNNYHERGLLTFGAYEIGTSRFLRNYIAHLRDCIVIDVGANIGIHTLTMCDARASNANVTVIAVEANPDMVARLESNLCVNNFDQVRVLPYGASSESAMLSLGLPYAQDDEDYHNPGLASMVQKDRAVRSIDVECRPLDEMISELGFASDRVGLIKMDIEGKELDALRGMQEILRRSRAAVIIEFNARNFPECRDFLERFDFRVVGSLVRYGVDAGRLAENILFMKRREPSC